MNEFAKRYPAVSIDLLLANRIVNLVEEGFDCAIRIGQITDASLVAIPISKVRRVLCASPEYLRAHGIPRKPTDIRFHRCVRFTGLAPHAEWPFRNKASRLNIPVSCRGSH